MPADERFANPERSHDIRRRGGEFIAGIGSPGRFIGPLQRLASGLFVAPGEEQQRQRADRRENPHPRVNEEGDEDVNRAPGCIEHAEDRGAAQRLAKNVEFAHDLLGQALRPGSGPNERCVEDRVRQDAVEPDAGAHQQARANRIENRKSRQAEDEDDGQEQQSRPALRRDYAVVNLQHVQHRHDEQQVEKRAEHGRIEEMPAARAKRGRHDLVLGKRRQAYQYSSP